jgi:hypothetical protein
MGSALAMREFTHLVPNTPHDPRDLVRELRDLTKKLRVRERLQGWTDAVHTLPRTNTENFKWLLLVLDIKKNTIKVKGYSSRREAYKDVAEIEQLKNDDLDAVLVWV